MSNEIDNKKPSSHIETQLAALGHMAANITHEINNPLQLVQLKLFKLEELIKTNPKKTDLMLENIDCIFQTIDRVSRIVESVRRQSKNITPVGLNQVSLRTIMENVQKHTSTIIEKYRVRLEVEFNCDYNINCNALEVEQVLINLINNACEASYKKVTPWVRITFNDQENQIVILVQDSGNGIEKDVIDKLMTPFFSTKKFPQGTGLGLNISRNLLERNDGQINYLADHKNTTFEIRIKKA